MKNPKTTKPGKSKKSLSPCADVPEKAEIAVEGADDLFKEIRIDNTLLNGKGKQVKLKEGAKVAVVIEGDDEATVPKTTDRKA